MPMSTKSPTPPETVVQSNNRGPDGELNYYYLYNPQIRKKRYYEKLNDFDAACRLADSLPGIWEVHYIKQRK